MRRIVQTFDEIIEKLTSVESAWQDEMAIEVERIWNELPEKEEYKPADVSRVFQSYGFEAAKHAVRGFLDLSKDDFERLFREALGDKSTGITTFRSDPEGFVAGLWELGLPEKMAATIGMPVTWRSVLLERLKSGRGSAIKGMRRGRFMEDFVEDIIRSVFGQVRYDVRCRFMGANRMSGENEKADFAIPSKEDPQILVEVKAYGATGSKLTDIIGDMERIFGVKRPDTTLLFFTDGVTWKQRANDLRKLIEMQNAGKIYRIYTRQMRENFRLDLSRLKQESGL